jgi:hypothetical protein
MNLYELRKRELEKLMKEKKELSKKIKSIRLYLNLANFRNKNKEN